MSASWARSYVISTPKRIATPRGAQRSAASRAIRSRSSKEAKENAGVPGTKST